MKPESFDHVLDQVDLAAGLADRRVNVHDPHHLQVVAEVRNWYAAVKEEQADVDQLLLPGGEWSDYVDERSATYDRILSGTVEEAAEILADFARNLLGPITAQYAYYPDLAAGEEQRTERFVTLLSRDIAVWEAVCDGERDQLSLPVVGNPWGLQLGDSLVSPQSMRFHHHSRRIAELLCDRPHPVVLELGGGFGGMVPMTLEAVGRPMTYVDVDLPETALIAAYFVRLALPERRVHLATASSLSSGVDIRSYEVVIAPNYLMGSIGAGTVDLFLNAFSLSEMPAEVIASYLGEVDRIGVDYILHNNVDRADVVNRGSARTPGSSFPIDPAKYKQVYRTFDLFQGHDGDYREFLYQRRSDA